MFDDIVAMQKNTPPKTIGPRTCTDTARKLVMCSYLSHLRRRVLNLLRLQTEPLAEKLHVDRLGYLERFGHGPLKNWRYEVFGYTTNAKFAMGVVVSEAKGGFQVLGLHRTGTSDVLEWERDGWLSIQDYCG
jgi:hypothetical protein